MNRMVKLAVAAAAFGAFSTPVLAQVVNDQAGTTVRVSSIEETVVSSQMVGMRVSAWFGNSGSPIVGTWANLGSTYGVSWGAFGSLGLGGATNTYQGLYTVTLLTSTDLDYLRFEGGPLYGNVIFDRSCSNNRSIGEQCSMFGGGGVGTTQSNYGTDYDINSSNSRWNPVIATYINNVALGMAAPVGDIFQQVDVDFRQFTDAGPDNSHSPFQFRMDTDLAVSTVPEPSTYALMGVGLAGVFGFARRRRRNA